MQRVVFTDLDGTLLDAESYEPKQSQAAIRQLQAAHIPIVFCSSKTRLEQQAIRQRLGVNDPYIVENGSAIILPATPSVPMSKTCLPHDAVSHPHEDETHVQLGVSATHIHAALRDVAERTNLALVGYTDLSLEQIIALTGLGMTAAEAAQKRDYSETIVTPLTDDEQKRFMAACTRRGLKALHGGRFMTVTGIHADKGMAVRVLMCAYRAMWGEVRAIGIGDSANDAPMLEATDERYLVQRPGGWWHEMDVPQVRRVLGEGPIGFANIVQRLLNP